MSEKAFLEAYQKLDTEQKKAVDTVEGPVMVIAGPGTGKTTVLTLRIANILRLTDAPPSGILALTYTDAGVKAMRKKLQDIIDVRAYEVHIHTFHGFAVAMMAEYPDHFLHIGDVRTITDVEQESLVRDILTDATYATLRPTGKPDAYLSSILETIKDAKRDTLSPEDVRTHAVEEAERIRTSEDSVSTRGTTKGKLKAEAEAMIGKCERTVLFADIYAAYEARKQGESLMDFDDLIISFLAALAEDELLRRLLQERFLYILVDEHQDTNDAQNHIIETLAEFFKTPNVFIVGDEKQAIYRFQGASVENFLLLQRRWPDMKVISLDTSYRSHQNILNASFAMIEYNYEKGEHEDLRVQLTARSGETSRPLDLVTGENVAATEEYLVKEIQRIMKDEPQATVAIIVRRNRELERILHVLEVGGVPVSSERSIDVFAHPVGIAFFDLMTYLADPTRTDALARTMIVGLWSLSVEGAADLIRQLRSGKTVALEQRLPGLRKIRAEMANDSPVGFVISACRHAGFAEFASLDPLHVHVWRGIIALTEAIVRDRHITNPADLLEALMTYRLSSQMKAVKVAVGTPDMTVRAMTAHGSKGLEFDYVFLPYVTEEAWVGKPRGASFVLPQKNISANNIRDTRRLFYVALTRARKHVAVLTALEEADGKALTPLRFIDELDNTSVSSITLPRADTPMPTADGKAKRDAQTALTNMAKQRLVTSGLSVTALNHFLNDPRSFLTESILQMPQAPSASAEKGNAMHAAMDQVWRSGEKQLKQVTKLIRTAVSDYLDDSFLPQAEKEAVRKELLDAAPIVATALVGHFQTDGKVFTERWVEHPFTVLFEGEEVTIPLHGKLDVLIDTGDNVAVYDYKTRQGMSASAVRGETKNSNGKYFRQLAFYALLLKNSTQWKGKHVKTSLVFVSPDKKGRCPILTLHVTEKDLTKLREEIQSLIEYVWSGKLEGVRF